MLDTIKKQLGITDTSVDALLNQLIEEGKTLVETYIGRKFWSSPITETYYNEPIIIHNTPATNIKVYVYNDGQKTEITNFEYDKGIIRLLDDVVGDKLEVTYDINGNFPDLERIVMNYAMRTFKKGKHAGEKSTSTEAGTTDWEEMFTPMEIEIMKRYHAYV